MPIHPVSSFMMWGSPGWWQRMKLWSGGTAATLEPIVAPPFFGHSPPHLPLAPPFSVPPLQQSHLPFTAEAASPSRNPFEESQKRRQHVCQRTVARPARTIFAGDCFYQTHCVFVKHSQGVFFIQSGIKLYLQCKKDGVVWGEGLLRFLDHKDFSYCVLWTFVRLYDPCTRRNPFQNVHQFHSRCQGHQIILRE